MPVSGQEMSRRGALGALTAGVGVAAATGGPAVGAVPAVEQVAPSTARTFAEFGALPDGLTAPDQVYEAMVRAWRSALQHGHDLHHSGGTYDIGNRNFPWRQPAGATSLLDCRNITISGEGPGSVFKTSSAEGADVFQLNALRNLHFRNLAVTASLTGSKGSGSNGISITGGYDNISLLDIWCYGLPHIDTGSEVDGGKALTIQCDAARLEVGVLTARIFARDCSQGFGLEVGLANFRTKKLAVRVELVAEGCYTAVAIGGPTATTTIPEDTRWGVTVSAQAINCQKDVWLARAYGVEVDCQVVTTASASRRRQNAAGAPWFKPDALVEALACAFAKNTRVSIVGNKGECDHKARIGGAVAGLGGFGTSANCELYIDVAGTARLAPVAEVDSGGNSLVDTRLTVSPATGPIPPGFFLPRHNNVIIFGSRAMLPQPSFAGPVTLLGQDGVTPIAKLLSRDDGLCIQQLSASAAEAPVVTFLNHLGEPVAKLRNDGLLAGSAIIRGRVPRGEVVAARPEYGRDGTLIGYVPVYRNLG